MSYIANYISMFTSMNRAWKDRMGSTESADFYRGRETAGKSDLAQFIINL